MGPITSIAAGLAAIVGALAILKFAEERRTRRARPLDERSAGTGPKAVLEFELDRASGVYRAK